VRQGFGGGLNPAAICALGQPAQSLRARVEVRTVYVGPEAPANADAFTQVVLGKAGEALPGLFLG